MDQEKTWHRIAEKWNEYKIKPSLIVVEFLEDKKGKILDLGCGSGRNFSAFNKNSIVYGVDFSEKMLGYAKKKAKKLGIKVKLKKSQSDKLPFKDNFFDSAICTALLHCISSNEKRQKTLKELFRVLKQNSKVLISVWSRNSPRLKNKPKECFIPWTIDKNNKNVKKQERYTYIYNKDELENEVKKSGFEILKSWEERNINIIAEKPR